MGVVLKPLLLFFVFLPHSSEPEGGPKGFVLCQGGAPGGRAPELSERTQLQLLPRRTPRGHQATRGGEPDVGQEQPTQPGHQRQSGLWTAYEALRSADVFWCMYSYVCIFSAWIHECCWGNSKARGLSEWVCLRNVCALHSVSFL